MLGPRADRTPPPRHEDGTVRFWDASGVSLKPLYKLGTANIFQTDCEHNDSLNQAGEEEWPPFRKVRSPGQGDTTMDLSTLPALPALEGANPELGTGDAPAGAIPAAPRGRVPRLGAQLLCDALWGHKGRLFRGPHPVGLPQHGGESQGVCGDRLLLGVMPRVCRVPQLVEGCGGAGGAAHSCVWGPGCPFSCPLPQVGCFDPYSDDPRLGVQKIALCKYTAKMVVAGTAGQVRWQGQSRGC